MILKTGSWPCWKFTFHVFQFDNVLVMLSTYFFDERMYADWGQWNTDFEVTAIVRITVRLALN